MQTMKPNAKGLSGRLLCVFLALMVLFSTAIVFRASAEDSAILTVGSVTVPLGTASVQVPVLVSNNTGVVSVSLQFTYSGLTLTAATNNAFDNITRNLPLGIINTYSDENLVGDFQFYVLTFAVTNPNIDKTYTIGVGTTDGRPNNFSAVKENGSVSATPVTFVAGSITVGTPSSDTPQVAGEVWDGSVDVTWYNTTDTVFYIDTPAKLEGLAAIVNGSYNTGATVYGDDDHTKIVQTRVADYGYGADFFDEKTIYITADLDFGGVKNAQGVWSGENNYMPIGGQYNMTLGDDNSHLSSSFNGTLDGLGHELKNIYCERADMTTTGAEPYKMSQSIGVVGRLGVHDGDPTDWRAFEPTVRNLVVGAGYISGRRSVGGIVGKTGKTQYNTDAVNGGRGAIVENVANYADIHGTDSKGTGGIVGASWNGGIILNSYNFGTITNGYTAPTGGISGYNENVITNAYNVGSIQGGGSNYSMAIGSNNGGQPVVYNAYYLIGSAAGGGYYSSGLQDSGIARTAEELKTPEFLLALNAGATGGNRAFVYAENADGDRVNDGYPVLRVWALAHAPDITIVGEGAQGRQVREIVKQSDPTQLIYAKGEIFSAAGIAIIAKYDDDSEETVTVYNLSKTTALAFGDTSVTVSGTYEGEDFSFAIPIDVYVLGDTDGSGTVTVSDARNAISLIGNRTLSGAELARVDVDGSGTITISDIRAIINLIGH